MPENQAVFPIHSLLSFDDDSDDGFGEFKFVPSPISPPLLFPDPPNPKQQQEDDDWGDFVVGSQSQSFQPPFPSSSPHFDPFPDSNPRQDPIPASSNKWEKPRGAIPLSVFGDDEVEEPESLDPNTLFGGRDFFSSNSSPFRTPAKDDGIGLGSGGGFKDLITDLYGQAAAGTGSNGGANSSDLAQGEDDFDESSWEFKDAFSDPGAAAGLKEEVKSEDVSGLEKEAAAGAFEFQVISLNRSAHVHERSNNSIVKVVVNKSESVEGASGLLRVRNNEREPSDVLAAHDGFTNGFGFDLDIAHNQCILDTSQQIKYVKNGNELHSSLENGDRSVEVKFWDSKDAFSENVVVTGSLGQQKTPDAEAELLMPTDKIQATKSLCEKNLGNLHTSTYTNGKEDLCGPFLDYSTPSGEPDSEGIGVKDFKLHSVVPVNDIISNLCDETDQSRAVYPTQCSTVNGQNLAKLGLHSVSINGHSYFDEIHWEFQKPSETTVSDKNSASEIDQSLYNAATENAFLDLYCRLKEESLFLIVRHLGDLKKAHEVACISGEQDKVLKTNEEIKAAYKKLQEAMISENVYMGKHIQKDVLVDQLLEFIKEPHFRALEQEYCLSERISSAEKDLSAAIGLFGHTTSVLHIMRLASREEQRTYIIAWSKMALACAQELQHGAMIWKESLGVNVREQILSRGNRYFVALGEIYRVAEILSASSRLYKPWILSNQGDSSKVIECLDKCAEAWMSSGLEEALKSISYATMDLDHEGIAKALLVSTRLIHDLDELSLQNHAFGHGKIICRLSLLPMDLLQDMKAVAWNGEHYFLKLVNLWTNRVSCDPPQLPQIHAS